MNQGNDTVSPSATPPELDSYGGWTGIRGEKTGFFHFENMGGRNWFVTPEGNAFFGVALSHLFSGESDLACANVYGGDVDAWMRDSFEKAQAMGFNCALGSATSPERNLNGFVDSEKAEVLFREANFPFSVGVILLKHPWEFVDGETLPDIYEPSYRDLIESRAEAVCPKYKDDPLVMGYYYGFGAFNQSDVWVNHHMSLPPGSAGREAITELLMKRYDNDVAKFNQLYGMSLTSIADLKDKALLVYEKEMDRRNYPEVRNELNRQKFDDFEAIISDMCTRLYRIAHDAIRKWDTDHLILGSFIKEWALSEASWKRVAPYVSLISPQHLNRTISLDEIGAAVDLPIVVSDEDAGWSYPDGAPGYCGMVSHDARCEVYVANLKRHYKDPQVLGVSYCACMYDQGGNTLKKKLQSGYHDLQGNPRENLIRAATEINHAVYEEARSPASPEELQALTDAFFAAWDRNKSRRA